MKAKLLKHLKYIIFGRGKYWLLLAWFIAGPVPKIIVLLNREELQKAAFLNPLPYTIPHQDFISLTQKYVESQGFTLLGLSLSLLICVMLAVSGFKEIMQRHADIAPDNLKGGFEPLDPQKGAVEGKGNIKQQPRDL